MVFEIVTVVVCASVCAKALVEAAPKKETTTMEAGKTQGRKNFNLNLIINPFITISEILYGRKSTKSDASHAD